MCRLFSFISRIGFSVKFLPSDEDSFFGREQFLWHRIEMEKHCCAWKQHAAEMEFHRERIECLTAEMNGFAHQVLLLLSLFSVTECYEDT